MKCEFSVFAQLTLKGNEFHRQNSLLCRDLRGWEEQKIKAHKG